MPDRTQERAAITLFIGAFRHMRSVALAIARDNPDDFPDFVLSRAGGKDLWVEVVRAVESNELLAASASRWQAYRSRLNSS